MTHHLRLLGVSGLALVLAAPAFAQGELLGTKALNDRVDDIAEDVSDDMARSEDVARFGNPEFRPGLAGLFGQDRQQ